MRDNGGAHDQNSPRMRGVNPSASHQGHCGRNFPRMREGQPAEQSAQFCIGNSPRMRGGQPEEGVRTTKRDGILPAYAGVNPVPLCQNR